MAIMQMCKSKMIGFKLLIVNDEEMSLNRSGNVVELRSGKYFQSRTVSLQTVSSSWNGEVGAFQQSSNSHSSTLLPSISL